MKNKILFDFYERMVIIDYYKNPKLYKQPPIVVGRYEMAIALREVNKEISRYINCVLDKLSKYLQKSKQQNQP